jgi:uncharacterized delta-60 repeat protein
VLALALSALALGGVLFACGSDDAPPPCEGAACLDGAADAPLADGAADGRVDAISVGDAADAADATGACPGPAGALDTAFGDGGMVWLKYPASGAHAVAVQGDGKIVVGGFSGGSSGEFAIVRLLPSGALDMTFGAGGLVERQVGALNSEIRALAVLPDGRILATGATREPAGQFTFTTLRLLADGGADPTFGSGGLVLTSIMGRDAYAASIAIQPDGKILVGGSSEDAFNPEGTADFEVLRYSPTGVPDTSFGSGGRATVDVAGTRDEPGVIAVAGGGSILVAGGSSATLDDPIHVNLAVARLNSAGAFDGTFGVGGRFVTSFGGRQRAYAVAVDSSGRPVLGGMNGTAADFGVYRLTGAGALDTSFGDGGATSDDFGATFDAVTALVTEESGKVIAIGSSSAGFGTGSIAAIRFLASGAHDRAFGTAGKSVTPPPANTDLKVAAAARTTCGYVVVGEWSYDNNTISKSAFGIAQYRR